MHILSIPFNLGVQPLGSVVTSFYIVQKALGSISGSPWDLSLMANYSKACMDWVFLCFIVLRPCYVSVVFGEGPCTLLTTGQRRSSNCVRILICGSYELQSPDTTLSSIKGS